MFRWILLCLAAAIGWADTASLFDLADIENRLEEADENTLIVFDVDEVLLTTEDHFSHPYALPMTKEIVQRWIEFGHDKKTVQEIVSLCFLLPKRILIEETAPAFIRRLQEKGVKTIALTSCQTGRLGHIERVEDWRIDDLRSFGIDFSTSFTDHPRIVFDEIKAVGRAAPLFQQGVLFSEGCLKGDVLKAFLERTGFTSSHHIVFVDDLVYNLNSVHESLEASEIPHSLFHYTGASRHFKDLDERVIETQLDHLIRHREWLSDAEAKARLQQTP
jgi:hypothetical protein